MRLSVREQRQLDTIGAVVSQSDAQLASMRNLVQSLVASDWQGAASSAFDGLYQQWNTSAASLREALDGISRLVANAATAYANTEQQIQQSMHG